MHELNRRFWSMIEACATCGCGQVPGGVSGPASAVTPVEIKCDRCGATGASRDMDVAPDGKHVCPHCTAKEAKATQRLVTKKLDRIDELNAEMA